MLIGTEQRGTDLIHAALMHTPSLVIDCANIADPHDFATHGEEALKHTYVLEIDLLYKFRDTAKRLDHLTPATVRYVTITSPQHLFDYGDDVENRNVMRHAFQLLRDHADDYTIVMDVPQRYEAMARRYCTTWGIRRAVHAKQ